MHKIDQSRLNFPPISVIDRLIQVAETVNKENPWASATSCPGFNRATATQDLDQHAKDIKTLADDIRAYSLHHIHNGIEFQPTLKFENEPTDAIATIRLFFADYNTFDVQDL